MSFRIHLLIVAIIITGLYASAHFFIIKPQAVTVIQAASISPYTIEIERASWGANCQQPFNSSATSSANSYEAGSSSKSRENNVLYNVSKLCNSKSQCDIPIDQNFLGPDPLPSCGYKTLQVEYRCFAVDRLHTLEGRDVTLRIDCDKQFPNQ